jgi:hypothetical protein
MINVNNCVPAIYYNTSRDFQLLGQIYEIVFNYIKTNTDVLYNNPLSDNSDKQLIDLMTYTLGFKPKHKYNTEQLVAVCSSLMTIFRNKGNTNSINYILKAIAKAEHVEDSPYLTFSPDYSMLNIFIPSQLTDIVLLNDLLDYVLPAGMTCTIYKETLTTASAQDRFISEDNVEGPKTDLNINYSIVNSDNNATPSSFAKGAIDNINVIGDISI